MGDAAAGSEVVARARRARNVIEPEAAASERLGRLTDTAADALHEPGLLRMLIPRDAGGLGATRLEFFDAVQAIAEADGSAGWCASVCNIAAYTAYVGLPQDGREEVFGATDKLGFWTSLAPSARSAPEPGGFRLTYPGVFGSGSSLSSWVLVTGNTGAPHEGRYRAFLVPRAEVEIKEGSWDVMGLKASASLDYLIEDRFVPERRTWEFAWAVQQPSGALSALESVRLNALGLSAFAAGVGRHALAELIASAKKTRRTIGDGLQSEDHVVQLGIGEIEGRLTAAQEHLRALIGRIDERAQTGRAEPAEDTIAISQATITLARAAREMTIFAFDHASASAVYSRAPLQRCLRDIFTGLKHASFTPAVLGRVGRVRLGLPTGTVAL